MSTQAITRPSGRKPKDLRPVTISRSFTKHAEGSVLIAFGDTKVLCTASILDKVPPHKRGSGEGWVTAEYGMLPRATLERTRREASAGKQNGRTVEIQRLIGRSLRAVVDLNALGPRSIGIDTSGLSVGTHTLYVMADYWADLVSESNEANNVTSVNFTVTAPTAPRQTQHATGMIPSP